MEANLFAYLDRAVGVAEEPPYWSPQAPFEPHSNFDLTLIPRVDDWQSHRGACRALERIERESWSDTAIRTRDRVCVRLDDGWIEKIASRLKSPSDAHARSGKLAGERRMAIYFWGANTTKALHVGHLRDLAIGNALSAALVAGGAQVERRSLISDIGRGMGEAIAGVVRSGRHLSSLHDLPEKSDHFVGNCYADYVSWGRSAAQMEVEATDSLNRESVMHDDSADAVLGRVLEGDFGACELWSKTREWVMSGHRETLARLGISFDKVIFESDFLAEMAELSDAGLQAGVLNRREDGVIVYVTGREELDEMPLVRPDGLPTQHMRALAYWAAAPELDGMLSVQVCGAEWVAHVTCRRKLIDELAAGSPSVHRLHPTRTLFHGMVAQGGKRLASSQGAFLIDELIEWIDAEIDRDPRRRAERPKLDSPDGLAAQIALGYFLLQPTGKSVELDPADFLRDGQSLGWDLARAQAHVRGDGAAGGDPLGDPEYRYAVVQAELLGYRLQATAESLDVMPIARQASHLAQWCVKRKRSPHVNGVMRLALDRAARGLGLHPRP